MLNIGKDVGVNVDTTELGVIVGVKDIDGSTVGLKVGYSVGSADGRGVGMAVG